MKDIIKTYRSVPWLILSFALISSVAIVVVGIIILAMWNKSADIPLGILTIVFGAWGMSGSIATFILSLKQTRANRRQAKFISQLSHELRTPLTSIKVYIETLEMQRFENDTDRTLIFEQLHDELQRIENLTHKVLGVFPDKKKNIRYEIQPEIQMRKILAPFFQCPEYTPRLSFEAEPALPLINVDADELNRAISNLVQNALTHSGNSARVMINAFTDEEGRLILRVRDQGPGIDENKIKALLEPFARGQQSEDQGVPGFGIGLSIVAQFADDTGAKLSAYNHEEGGAVFELRFPLSRLVSNV